MRVVEKEPGLEAKREFQDGLRGRRTGGATNSDYRGVGYTRSETTGWRQTCRCSTTDVRPATVLDCFAGSGTTLQVALEEGRSAIGIELNPKYCSLIKKRLDKVQLPIPGKRDTVMTG